MMGWMHDTLRYLQRDTIYRGHHQSELTFSMLYAFTEKFALPLSHDEVVHGKGSLLDRMPGDEWQKFANLRLLYGYMYAHPGDKLLFMGAEIGQPREWSLDHGIEWHLTDYHLHSGIQKWVTHMNRLFKDNSAFWEDNFSPKGFEWIAADDTHNSVIAFLRKSTDRVVLVVCNFSPNCVDNYQLGVPHPGVWQEMANSDAKEYGGSGLLNGRLTAKKKAYHGHEQSILVRLAPLSVMIFGIESNKLSQQVL
jgi:1,4-alpha-glucan branching enzyme